MIISHTMKNFTAKSLAFVHRDFINDISYKFAFFMQILSIFISTVTFFFLSRLFGNSGTSYMEPYGGNYFAFVLIGIAFFSYFRVSMESISKSIRDGQMLGTLEAMLVTQTNIPTIIFSSTLYSFLFASLKVFIYLLLGIFIFDVSLGNANPLGAIVMLFLTIISFSSLGIISASFVMVLKKGDPISKVLTGVTGVIGGLYYPISVLPDWLQILSYLLPVTYSLEGMRMALLEGYELKALMPNVMALVIFSIITLPLSFFIFSYAVKRAKIDGTLTQY